VPDVSVGGRIDLACQPRKRDSPHVRGCPL